MGKEVTDALPSGRLEKGVSAVSRKLLKDGSGRNRSIQSIACYGHLQLNGCGAVSRRQCVTALSVLAA
jgi:hypothetical protein